MPLWPRVAEITDLRQDGCLRAINLQEEGSSKPTTTKIEGIPTIFMICTLGYPNVPMPTYPGNSV